MGLILGHALIQLCRACRAQALIGLGALSARSPSPWPEESVTGPGPSFGGGRRKIGGRCAEVKEVAGRSGGTANDSDKYDSDNK